MYWLFDLDKVWPPYQAWLHEAPVAHNQRAIPAHDLVALQEARSAAHRIAPGVIYKYRDLGNKFHRSLLENFSLWIPQFESLNDPFDGSMPIGFDYESVQSKLALRQFNKKEIRQALRVMRYAPSSQLTASLRRTIRWIGGLSGHALWDAKFIHARIGIARTYCGVSSFSSNYKNILLWSHYANSHSGVCIGFDLHSLRFEFLKSTDPVIFGEVEYVDNVIESPITSDELDIVKRYFLTKSTHWEYEQEYRVLTPHLCNSAISLNKEAFREITLGVKISPNDKRFVLDVVSSLMPHVLIYQAKVGNGICIEREQIK